MAAALWVAKEVGLKKGKREKMEPWWKRRIESNTWEGISPYQRGKDEDKLEGKERGRLRNWMLNIKQKKGDKPGYWRTKSEVDCKEN